jgi:ABC-type branched-subunit amino acid transport system substrate-binding protein
MLKMEMFKKAMNAVKPQPAKTWPLGEFRDGINALIGAAQKAGIASSAIASALEAEAESIRTTAARNIDLSPKRYFDGRGRAL